MQREGQLLFVTETTAIDATLELLRARGAASATLELRLKRGTALVEVLGPPTMGARRAVDVGRELAALPGTLGVAVVALRRRETAVEGRAFDRHEVASWSRPVGSRSPVREAA